MDKPDSIPATGSILEVLQDLEALMDADWAGQLTSERDVDDFWLSRSQQRSERQSRQGHGQVQEGPSGEHRRQE